jgi:hypothetical protein
MLKPVFSLLMLLFIASTLAAQISSSQTSIYFDQGKPNLSPKNETEIKDFLKKAPNPNDFELIAYIYTDTMPDSKTLPELRLSNVKLFLSEHGFPRAEVKILKVNTTLPLAERRNSHNKVELKLMSVQPRSINDMHAYFDEKYRETIFYSNRQDTFILTPSGANFKVKANSFVQKNGQAATPPIRIEIRYVTHYTEMGLLKISTLSDGQAMSTQLAFNISAFDAKGNALELARDKKIEVVIGIHPTISSSHKIFTADRAATDIHSPINWTATADTFAFAPKVKSDLFLLVSFYYRNLEGSTLEGTPFPFPSRPVYKVGLPPIAPKANNASTYAAALQKYKADSLAYVQQNAAAFAYSDSIASAMSYMLLESRADRYTNTIIEQIDQCNIMKAQINYYDEIMAQATAFGFDDLAKEFAEYKKKLNDNIDGGKITESIRRVLIQSSKTPLFNAFLSSNIDKMQIFKPKANAIIRDKTPTDDDYQRNYQHNNRNTPDAPTFEAYCESFYKRVGYTLYNGEFVNAMIAIQKEGDKMGFATKIQNAAIITFAAAKSTDKLKARFNDLGYTSEDIYILPRMANISHLGWFALAEISHTPVVPTLKIRLTEPVNENTYFFGFIRDTKTLYAVNVVDNAYEVVAPNGFPKNTNIMIVGVKVNGGNYFIFLSSGRPADVEKMSMNFKSVKLNNFWH